GLVPKVSDELADAEPQLRHRSDRRPVGITFKWFIRIAPFRLQRLGLSVPLLDDMGKLVGEERIANQRPRRVLPLGEYDVVANGERPSLDRPGCCCPALVSMDTDVVEVVLEHS